MKGNSLSKLWPIFIFSVYLSIASCQPGKGIRRKIGCQEKSTSGHSYAGEANTTVDGIPCRRWSDTVRFTQVGDHNFCRNPIGSSQSQVWCYTMHPEVPYQNCSVLFCPSLKALDFSLDNDFEPDENNSCTHASLQKENLPTSFTICTAFMVEAWTKFQNTWMFVLNDDKGDIWHWVKIYADLNVTYFRFQFEDSLKFSVQSESLTYPLQWTRVCLSRNSNTSMVRLVVDKDCWMSFVSNSSNSKLKVDV